MPEKETKDEQPLVVAHDEAPLEFSVWPYGAKSEGEPFIAVLSIREDNGQIDRVIVRVPQTELRSFGEAALFVRAVSIATLMAEDLLKGESDE